MNHVHVLLYINVYFFYWNLRISCCILHINKKQPWNLKVLISAHNVKCAYFPNKVKSFGYFLITFLDCFKLISLKVSCLVLEIIVFLHHSWYRHNCLKYLMNPIKDSLRYVKACSILPQYHLFSKFLLLLSWVFLFLEEISDVQISL